MGNGFLFLPSTSIPPCSRSISLLYAVHESSSSAQEQQNNFLEKEQIIILSFNAKCHGHPSDSSPSPNGQPSTGFLSVIYLLAHRMHKGFLHPQSSSMMSCVHLEQKW